MANVDTEEKLDTEAVEQEAEQVVDKLELSGEKKLEKYVPPKVNKDVPLPKELQPRKLLVEEVFKIIIGVILVILFIALFIGIVWYFMIQLDSTLFDSLLGEETTAGCILSDVTWYTTCFFGIK